ncbi:MAG: 50S ribosomal protein L4 [Candidatus Nomurabacteria bacterium]|jgi:large subunit ribosomal protein L4|nr:50S ribosomal protein L4 [Candidatus Nomurabacteria bacterium]
MAEIKLDKNVFGVKVENHELLKVAYNAYLAESRMANAKTLKRGEVRGGGKKPWKQKGTGRARFGSTRNPIWRGGGIAFGPTGEQNYKLKLSKTAKKVALRQALSLQNTAKKLAVVADFAPKEMKTKLALKFLADNGVKDENVLLVVAEKTDEIVRSTDNIANLQVVRATYLTVFDILNADKILITESALPVVAEWLAGDKEGKK